MEKVYRILDANLNRAKEGIRVIEDFTRFILEDPDLSRLLKETRANLSSAAKNLPHPEKLITYRDIQKDTAKFLNTVAEMRRVDWNDLLLANIKRVQESMRSLEEFSKLLSTNAAKGFKQVRFSFYNIEKDFLQNLNNFEKKKKLDFTLYVVTGGSKKSPLVQINNAIKGGAKIVQYRDKHASKKEYFAIAKKIAQLCKNKKVVFIVNDYPDICKSIDADGVHLGQDDMPVSKARKIVGVDKLIGLSTHSIAEAVKGAKSGADYISFGPVFETPSKPGWQPLGIVNLRQVLSKVKIPIVAIGGIDKTNIKTVAETFTRAKQQPRIAVIRAVTDASNIPQAFKELENLAG
ncbi:MAG: thiamine phosphate synthase [Candidatus Saganbacteria bacterium]|nr:thiamine phosphate synthase [Candidatus Saganbacteria bacterium]